MLAPFAFLLLHALACSAEMFALGIENVRHSDLALPLPDFPTLETLPYYTSYVDQWDLIPPQRLQ